jgi:hypothetical protein
LKSSSSTVTNAQLPLENNNIVVQEEGTRKNSTTSDDNNNNDTSALTKPEPVHMSISPEERQRFYKILSENKLILLHAESYRLNDNSMLSPSSSSSSFSSKFLHFVISSSNRQTDARFDNADTTFSNKLILITRAASNLYRQVQHGKNAEVYLLSLSTSAPFTKSSEGLIIISLTNTSLIVEAVRHTLEQNPSSTILFDNITELAHTIGFEKIHRFIQALNEVIVSFPNAHLLLLVNKHAHQPHETQSIANLFNIFIQ